MTKGWNKSLISLMLAFLFLMPAGLTVSGGMDENCNSGIAKKWTWIFYDDADFTPGFDPLYPFASQAYSSENLNVVVLQDTYGDSAKIWYIDRHHNPVLREGWGEVNMGDYHTLKNFVEYAKNNYPAERYLLSFYDHGMGWRGACIDDTDNDHLTMDEIQKALTETGGVDVICFTAPCVMGALESVYELRNLTKVYIGSEELSGYAWWWYVIGDICDILNQEPDIDEIELGGDIIELIYKDSDRWSDYDFGDQLTMSAIRTDRIEELADAIDTVAQHLIDNFEVSSDKVESIYYKVQKFEWEHLIDVYNFAENYLSVETNQTICQEMENVMECLQNAVIAECHGSAHPDAHGLTIYFPNPHKYGYETSYSSPGYGLDFSRDTHWDEFLEYYLGMKPYVIVYGISGGLGVNAYLKNIGGRYGSDISWEIIIDAPLMLSGRISRGSVSIGAGEVVQIESDTVMGIGPATISVITDNDKKTMQGFVVGPFVLLG